MNVIKGEMFHQDQQEYGKTTPDHLIATISSEKDYLALT